MTIEKVRQVLNKHKQNIIKDMSMITAIGKSFNDNESRFDKGKIVEHVIATHQQNILNDIGRDVDLEGQVMEVKSRQRVLYDPTKQKNHDKRYHRSSGLLCIPRPIILHNPQDNNPVEITRENITKWCSHSVALVAVDTDHLSISIASFKDIEKLPSECFSGSTSIEVHLPLYIMEKFITNEEIMECTEEDLQNAKYRVLELLSNDRGRKLGIIYEDFIKFEYERLYGCPNNLFDTIFGGLRK